MLRGLAWRLRPSSEFFVALPKTTQLRAHLLPQALKPTWRGPLQPPPSSIAIATAEPGLTWPRGP